MASDHEESMSALRIWSHVHSSLLGIIFLSTLILNGLLILVLRKMKSRRSNRDRASYNIERSYMYLLFHLALADMLGVILNIPFDILRNAGIKYYFTSAGCQILPPFQLASTTAQAGTYVALSYHRFRAIVHPIREKLTVYKSLIMITMIWVIGTCLSMPFIIVNRFNETSTSCYENWNKNGKTIYTFVIFVVQYAAPVTLMAVFYIIIARTLEEHRIQKERIHVPTQDDVRSHKHIVKMLVTIVTVYSVCMLPHHLFWIVTGLHEVDKTVYKAVSNVSYLFTYSNSVANPVIFFFYNKESRYHIKRFFKYLCCPRTLDVPFEIKKWSATWSGLSKSDSQRMHERTSKDQVKLDQLFLAKPGDSDLGVSLPWEAQVMHSYGSSEDNKDYPSSPTIPEYSLSPGNPLAHTAETTNTFMYSSVPKGTKSYLSETSLEIAHGSDELVVDDNACVEGGADEDNLLGVDGVCDLPVGPGVRSTMNETEGMIDSEDKVTVLDDEEGISENQKDRVCDEISLVDDEQAETVSNFFDDDTTRVQRMIERMIQDITQELKQDGCMNGMKRLEDILNLNESSSNGDWEAIIKGEGLNGSAKHLSTSAQDLVKDMTECLEKTDPEQGCEKDIDGLRERLKSLPETRM